ncbi:unnamed protein product [Cuscuta epithymum]|uniref:Uncharacterized protein n=1 Tax=Cuscuta epithymum TaxID=186058 RepID=A0AAV0CGJ0_9ASTE|nr:unnamed protein product [Cuscuta epithymum]
MRKSFPPMDCSSVTDYGLAPSPSIVGDFLILLFFFFLLSSSSPGALLPPHALCFLFFSSIHLLPF